MQNLPWMGGLHPTMTCLMRTIWYLSVRQLHATEAYKFIKTEVEYLESFVSLSRLFFLYIKENTRVENVRNETIIKVHTVYISATVFPINNGYSSFLSGVALLLNVQQMHTLCILIFISTVMHKPCTLLT